MSPRLALYFLGSPQLYLGNEPIPAERRKAVALLAYLALERGQHRRESLSALLWPDYDQSKAFTNLRHTLWEIQQSLGEGWLNADREKTGLNDRADIWLDVQEFESLFAQSHAQNDSSLRIPLFVEATKLYRNHFLNGFSLKDAPSFNEWAFAKSEDLRCQLAGVLTRLSEDYCALGQAEKAIPYARRLITLDPLNESAHCHLMNIYVQAGQHDAALKQYQTCEELLRKELNLDPQPETYALYKQIRKGELKPDLVVKSAKTTARKHNLPLYLTTFVGREKEINDVIRLLEKARIVSLIGTGGVGKTRLSIQSANKLLNTYNDGVWLVELAPILDPTLVPRTTVIAVGLRGEPEQPVIDRLCEHLREKHMLVILDDCGHLIEACAHMADKILHAAPHVHILVSSREALGIAGEVTYPVPSLELPDINHLPPVGALSQCEAIRLFIDRATSAVPAFTVTNENASFLAQICCRLDGIPLAIELAAAKVRVLSVKQIAERLDQRFRLLTGGSRTALERHQTLRATINWSYNLLTPSEQTLFRRLSVFTGGWRLEAAEAICSDEPSASVVRSEDILNLLEQLINKSLVVVEEQEGETRYHFLETIREYALEKLSGSGEEQKVRNRHLDFFISLAEEGERHYRSREQSFWFRAMERERDNFRGALDYVLHSNQPETSLRFIGAAFWLWFFQGPWSEGQAWVEVALAQAANERTLAKAKALMALGLLQFSQSDHPAAQAALEKSLAIWQELDATWWSAFVLDFLGLTMRRQNREAGHLFQESLRLAQATNDEWLLAFSLWHLGENELHLKKLFEAKRLLDESLTISRTLGDKMLQNEALRALGEISEAEQDYRRAIDLYKESLAIIQELHDVTNISVLYFNVGRASQLAGENKKAEGYFMDALLWSRRLGKKEGVLRALAGLGVVAEARGEAERALRLLIASQALYANLGFNFPPNQSAWLQRHLESARAQLNAEQFAAAWAEGKKMTLDLALKMAEET